jgi:hypothetical protein
MIQKIDQPVSVTLDFDCRRKVIFPSLLWWNNRPYSITEVGLHHTYKKGKVLYHVFSVVSGDLFFRLVLDTESLGWRLEEIADGF